MRASLLAAVLSIALAASAAAQIGRVTGLVKDDHGDPVKGATIIAENPDASPTSFTASTDEKLISLDALEYLGYALNNGIPASYGRYEGELMPVENIDTVAGEVFKFSSSSTGHHNAR